MHDYLDFYFELFWKNYFWKLKLKKYRKKGSKHFWDYLHKIHFPQIYSSI